MQNWKAKLRPKRRPQGRSGPVRHILGDAPDVPIAVARAEQNRIEEAAVFTPPVYEVVRAVAEEYTARDLGVRSQQISEAAQAGWDDRCARYMDVASTVLVRVAAMPD